MKKVFLLLLLCIILTGCSKDENVSKNTVATSSSTTKTDNVVENTEASNNDSKQQEEFDIPSSTFELSSSNIAQIIYGKTVDYYSTNIDKYTVDVFPNTDYFIFCVTLNGEDYPALVYTYDQVRSGTPDSSEVLIQPFLNTLSDNENVVKGSYNLSNSSRGFIYCVWIKDSEVINFPLTTQILPDTDYFLSTDIEEYKLACTEGRYNDILSDVQTYIETTNPPSYDNAYILQSILSPIIADWENIDVQYDSIEKFATFSYSKVNNISDNIHFVPYALTNEKRIHALIGFYDSDWLFFENIIISSNENIIIPASNGKVEDVISGGKIYEAYDISLDDDDIAELLTCTNHTIRFKAQDGTYKDYEMTIEEYEALACLSKFQNVRNILSDLLFHFQKQLPES